MAITELLSSALATGILGLPMGLSQANLPGTEIAVDSPARKGWVMYTVQPGDTLSGIALKFYGDASRDSYMKIARANNIANPDLIKVGQKLQIPR